VRRRLFPNTFWGLVEEIFSGDDEFSSAGEVIVSILSFSWFVGRTCGAFPFFPFFGLGKATRSCSAAIHSKQRETQKILSSVAADGSELALIVVPVAGICPRVPTDTEVPGGTGKGSP